ncbi:hypothetical protein KIPB_002624 [Kipferlia bialata]|uniref:Tyrosine-protein kinase ephrin type A/B receptor-like domain-containing protein n=1 Tax=Kipferlia bialata TaxID=797122 RepID=A0A9K3CS19_9EUKA|nr:hypothetical protein KIPB_002624 [Kipferlia bialata]|eukprot:g2624.t1
MEVDASAADGFVYRITALDLSNNNLVGYIPNHIGQLTACVSLNVSGNEITGPLPAALGSMSSLQNADVSGNTFYGQIPEGFCSTTTLEVFNASGNQIRALPDCFGGLTSLTHLDLSANDFTLTLPSHFEGLTSLVEFDISDNLYSTCTDVFAGWTQLVSIDMSGNAFQNELPSSLFSCPLIETIHLENNGYTESLPDTLASTDAAGLREVYLQGNKLSGSIPEGILSNHPSLTALDLSDNSLEGGIMADCYSDTYCASATSSGTLSTLSLASNSLDGLLVTGICPALTFLDITGNVFSCPIPDDALYVQAVCECEPGSVGNRYDGCTECGEGYQQPLAGMSVCDPCPIGTYGPEVGMDYCLDCVVGEYQPSLGMTECVPCIDSTTLAEGSGSSELCVCDTTRVGYDNVCSLCPDAVACPGGLTLLPTLGYWLDASSVESIIDRDYAVTLCGYGILDERCGNPEVYSILTDDDGGIISSITTDTSTAAYMVKDSDSDPVNTDFVSVDTEYYSAAYVAPVDAEGVCIPGHTHSLCSACSEDYFRPLGMSHCVPCPSGVSSPWDDLTSLLTPSERVSQMTSQSDYLEEAGSWPLTTSLVMTALGGLFIYPCVMTALRNERYAAGVLPAILSMQTLALSLRLEVDFPLVARRVAAAFDLPMLYPSLSVPPECVSSDTAVSETGRLAWPMIVCIVSLGVAVPVSRCRLTRGELAHAGGGRAGRSEYAKGVMRASRRGTTLFYIMVCMLPVLTVIGTSIYPLVLTGDSLTITYAYDAEETLSVAPMTAYGARTVVALVGAALFGVLLPFSVFVRLVAARARGLDNVTSYKGVGCAYLSYRTQSWWFLLLSLTRSWVCAWCVSLFGPFPSYSAVIMVCTSGLYLCVLLVRRPCLSGFNMLSEYLFAFAHSVLCCTNLLGVLRQYSTRFSYSVWSDGTKQFVPNSYQDESPVATSLRFLPSSVRLPVSLPLQPEAVTVTMHYALVGVLFMAVAGMVLAILGARVLDKNPALSNQVKTQDEQQSARGKKEKAVRSGAIEAPPVRPGMGGGMASKRQRSMAVLVPVTPRRRSSDIDSLTNSMLSSNLKAMPSPPRRLSRKGSVPAPAPRGRGARLAGERAPPVETVEVTIEAEGGVGMDLPPPLPGGVGTRGPRGARGKGRGSLLRQGTTSPALAMPSDLFADMSR